MFLLDVIQLVSDAVRTSDHGRLASKVIIGSCAVVRDFLSFLRQTFYGNKT